jgi:hypothetical protein
MPVTDAVVTPCECRCPLETINRRATATSALQPFAKME